MVIGGGQTAADEQAARLAALTAGAADYLVRPLDEASFLARVRSLMRHHGQPAVAAALGAAGAAGSGAAPAAADPAAGLGAMADIGLAEPQAAPPEAPPRIALVSPDARESLEWRRALARRMRCPHLHHAPATLFEALHGGPLPEALGDLGRRRSACRTAADRRTEGAARNRADPAHRGRRGRAGIRHHGARSWCRRRAGAWLRCRRAGAAAGPAAGAEARGRPAPPAYGRRTAAGRHRCADRPAQPPRGVPPAGGPARRGTAPGHGPSR